jgi:hypothetical protein
MWAGRIKESVAILNSYETGDFVSAAIFTILGKNPQRKLKII